MKLLSTFLIVSVLGLSSVTSHAEFANNGGVSLNERTTSLQMLSPSKVFENNKILKLEEPEIPVYMEPQGVKTYYDRSSYGFFVQWMWLYFGSRQGGISVIEGEDGFTYIHNPFSGWCTNSYLKGIREGNKIKVEVPQIIYEEEDIYNPGEILSFYAVMMNRFEDENGNSDYEVADDVDYVIYEIDEEGNISLNTGYEPEMGEFGNYIEPETIFGMCDQNGLFYVGDAIQNMNIADVSPIMPPSNLEKEEWILYAFGSGHSVEVGFDGTDVYLYNFDDDYAPGTWIKGYLDNNYITFPSGQFLIETNGFLYRYLAADIVNGMMTVKDSVTFKYDMEKKLMITGETDCLVSNPVPDSITFDYPYYHYYENPAIKYPSENISSFTPQNPKFSYYRKYSDYNYAEFIMYAMSEDFDELNKEEMFFRLYIDGEPLSFMSEETGNEFFDLPLGYNFEYPDYVTFECFGTYHNFYLYFDGFDTIGVQLFNNSENGITYSSDIVTYDIATGNVYVDSTTGINNKSLESEIVSIEYFDLGGQKIQNPDKGIFIVKKKMADGTFLVSKIIK